MILYFKKNSKRGPKVQTAIAEVYAKVMTAICYSLEDALFSTTRSVAFRDIIVLLVEDQRELANLSGYASQLMEHNQKGQSCSTGPAWLHPEGVHDVG